MSQSSTMIVWKAIFGALGCFMVATLVYTIATDGSPFRRELLTPWMMATLIDFYVNVVAIAAWVVYKEQTWISAIIAIIMLWCFGSITTCAYIVKKISEVLFQDLGHDPVHCLLLRNDGEQRLKGKYLLFGKTVFSILGILMTVVVGYTVITDGVPFRMELLTPWMAATLIDFYINVFAISGEFMDIYINLDFIVDMFGSIATCAYIVIQLSRLTYHDTVYDILLPPQSKAVNKKTPLRVSSLLNGT